MRKRTNVEKIWKFLWKSNSEINCRR